MAKCVFLDSDILIDVFAKRAPFYDKSAEVLELAETGKYLAFTSPLVVANVHYVLQRFSNKAIAGSAIRKIRTFVGIVDMNQRIVDRALNSDLPDFEDALQIYSAENAIMDLIVTRNLDHFKSSTISAMSPGEALAVLNQ
jgi:predicted nucleic acid-binding protein